MKIRILIVLATALLSIFFLKNLCNIKPKDNAFAHPEIVDYIHRNGINPLFKKADTFKYNQDYIEAAKAFKEALEKAVDKRDKEYALNQLAYVYLNMNDDSTAHQYIKKMEALYPLSNEAEADYFYNVGVWRYHTFDTKNAEQPLQNASKLYTKLYGENHLKTALSLTLIGNLYYEFSQEIDTPFDYIPKAHKIFTKNKALIPFSAECELGMAYINITKRSHDESENHCDKALNILKKIPFQDTILKARCLSLKGQMLKKQAQNDVINQVSLFKKADVYLRQAVDLAKPTKHIRVQQFYRELIINDYWLGEKKILKDSTTFFKHVEELKKILNQQQDIFGQPEKLIGYYFYNKKKYDRSRDYHLIALQKILNSNFQNVQTLGETLNLLRLSYLNLGDFSSAEYYLKKLFAHRLLLKNDNININRFFDVAVHKNTSYIFFCFMWMGETYYEKYKKKHQIKDLELAYKAYKQVDALLYPGIPSHNEEAILTIQKEAANNTYSNALELAYILYKKYKNDIYLEDAFKFFERSKSFLLYRDLPSREDSLIKKFPPQATLNRIRVLGSDINQLSLKKLDNIDVSNELTVKQEELDRIFAQIKQDFSDYYTLKVTQPIPSIKSVQTSLKNGTSIIHYFMGKTKLHALMINQNIIEFIQIDSLSLITQHINTLRYELSDSSDSDIQPYLRSAIALHDSLIKPFKKHFSPKNEIVIMPDKLMHLIPFEAFVNADSLKNSNNFKYLPYMVKEYPLSYSPAWKVYQSNLHKKTPINPTLACFTYGDKPHLKDNLKDAAKELEAIEKVWNNSASTNTSLFRKVKERDCRKKVFLKYSTQYDILHLSLHGNSDLKNKNSNRIYFKIPLSDTLNGYEIAHHRFNNFLVVLSACNTLLGKTETSEGVYSLARSFLQAGANHVVASLWKINDAKTSELIPYFYQNLRVSSNPALALYFAKNEFLANNVDETTAHPKYWAGLVCTH